jgi:hypothetical protein
MDWFEKTFLPKAKNIKKPKKVKLDADTMDMLNKN